jgi:hypothetical protein
MFLRPTGVHLDRGRAQHTARLQMPKQSAELRHTSSVRYANMAAVNVSLAGTRGQLRILAEWRASASHISQVLLTPGIIFGRFKIGMDTPTRPINLIFGAGYQFSVTSNPVTANNWVATTRITF